MQKNKKTGGWVYPTPIFYAIYPLIQGGTTVGYGAHLVPESGLKGVPPYSS